MSGIFGYINSSSDNMQISKDSLKHLANWNKAYGSTGTYLDASSYGLGAYIERLNDKLPINSIIIDNEEKCAVIDAVIYNRDELLDELSLDKDNISDEELLLFYIDKYGYKSLAKVNGDFAGAVFDKANNTLTLFRDHMGIRPLFYYLKGECAYFSTDIRGIISVPEVDCSISEDWIYRTARGAIRTDLVSTEYENIFCVMPGSFMRISITNGRLNKMEKTYWRIGRKRVRLSSDKAYQKKLRELIEDSVKRRLDAVSGTVGAELSGGLDSGVISILINRFGRKCIYYSWSESPDKVKMAQNDERLVIQDICKQEKIECHYGDFDLKEGSVFFDTTSKTDISIDDDELLLIRYALPPYINTIPITKSAEYISNHGGRVIFSGHGGDEGVSHRADPFEMFYNHEYYHYLRYMFSTTHGLNRRIWRTLRICKQNLVNKSKALNKPYFAVMSADSVLKKSFAGKFNEKELPTSFFNISSTKYIRQGGSRARLDNIALLGAYCKIRYVIPFLDYRVVDYAVSIPRYQYIRGRKNRFIYREAFKDIMPASMYRHNIKQDTSFENMESDEDWFEGFKKERDFLIHKLDRQLWDKYLDFALIDKWNEKGKPETDEESSNDDYLFFCLLSYAAAQNVIDKTRKKI